MKERDWFYQFSSPPIDQGRVQGLVRNQMPEPASRRHTGTPITLADLDVALKLAFDEVFGETTEVS